MTRRGRAVGFAVVCVVAVAAAAAYVVNARDRQADVIRNSPRSEQTSLERIEREPRIVFRHTGLGEDYGKVAMVSLADPDGPRAMTEYSCDRVYATDPNMLCLSADRGLVTTYAATVTSADGSRQDLPLAGVPSRARLSKDGRHAATTSFVTGHSYAAADLSTSTVVSDLVAGTDVNLEDFRLVHHGRTIKPVDRNFWGVTFGDDGDLFYATVAWDGKTWLVRGSLQQRQVVTVRSDVECPSLSPDGRQLAYKKRGDLPPGQWRLAAMDLATGREVMLAETRSVDDQVEWLDDTRVIYGIPRGGDEGAMTDTYSVPADGSGAPELLVEQAWSAAVVHPS
jgi:dipeptidyl aminopeptidase/acylaminoacyl peptidase